jgi:hypothetical protein
MGTIIAAMDTTATMRERRDVWITEGANVVIGVGFAVAYLLFGVTPASFVGRNERLGAAEGMEVTYEGWKSCKEEGLI